MHICVYVYIGSLNTLTFFPKCLRLFWILTVTFRILSYSSITHKITTFLIIVFLIFLFRPIFLNHHHSSSSFWIVSIGIEYLLIALHCIEIKLNWICLKGQSKWQNVLNGIFRLNSVQTICDFFFSFLFNLNILIFCVGIRLVKDCRAYLCNDDEFTCGKTETRCNWMYKSFIEYSHWKFGRQFGKCHDDNKRISNTKLNTKNSHWNF